MSKHIIFLGAGASKSSGYPLANELTLLMCDKKRFQNALKQALEVEGDSNARAFSEDSVVTPYFDSFRNAASLLRNGDFTTMDELSRLAVGGRYAGDIAQLKKLMRLVFALNNPDTQHYADSDYRPFIQSLFRGSNKLRDDIAILSFNYDPYFDFRLCRAFLSRQRVNPHNPNDHEMLQRAITSGFTDPTNTDWLGRPGFCHLKLHGVAVLPGRSGNVRKRLPIQPGDDLPLSAFDLFSFEAFRRLSELTRPPFSTTEPPVLLPWEIVHDDGRLLNEMEFRQAVGKSWEHAGLYPLFSGIWKRARDEVANATKVSFVGLSMGAFLEPELKFLFHQKQGAAEFCVVNPANDRFKNYSDPLYDRSPRGRAHAVLEKLVDKEFRFLCSSVEANKLPVLERFERAKENYSPEITAYSTFAEFIETELADP